MSYAFCRKFHTLECKKIENRLRFDKATESLKVGTFLGHGVVTTVDMRHTLVAFL